MMRVTMPPLKENPWSPRPAATPINGLANQARCLFGRALKCYVVKAMTVQDRTPVRAFSQRIIVDVKDEPTPTGQQLDGEKKLCIMQELLKSHVLRQCITVKVCRDQRDRIGADVDWVKTGSARYDEQNRWEMYPFGQRR